MTWRMLVFGPFLTLVSAVMAVPAAAQTPLAVEYKTQMKFGKVASTLSAGGTVILSPSANTTTLTGNLIDFGGTIKRGKFKLTGEPKTWVVITMPTTIVLQKGTSSNTMTVSNLTLSTSNPVKLNKNGVKNVFFGGTLTVGSNQKKGNYKNQTFVVSAEYQ